MVSQVTWLIAVFAALAASSQAVDVESSLISTEGRQSSPVTIFTTTTIPGTTTAFTTTNKVCGVLGTSVNVILTSGTSTLTSTFTNSPTRVCRRKRGFFDDAFVGISRDDTGVQFYRLSPSQVMRFEPSRLPAHFPNSYPSSYSADVVYGSPDVLEPSLARQRPIFGGLFPFGNLFSSLIYSLVSNAIATRSTVTSTVSVYAYTSTVTSFTSTSKFFLAGTCYPGGVTLC